MQFLDFLREAPDRERQRSRKPAAERQSQTRTREKPEVGPDLGAFERGAGHGFQAPAKHEKPTEPGVAHVTDTPAAKPELKRANRAQTSTAVGGVEMHPDAAAKFADIMGSGMQDVLSDEDAARIAHADTGDATTLRTPGFTPEPKTPTTSLAVIETMPAMINKKLAKEGLTEPDWHQVKHLPGYMVSAVRAIGRAVFAPFTGTPIENIQVVANLGDGGKPNSAKEVDGILSWLHKHARRDTEAELWFGDVIPDYDAKIICYKASGFTFLAVKDFAGNYIYSWPTDDEKALTQQHWDDDGDDDDQKALTHEPD